MKYHGMVGLSGYARRLGDRVELQVGPHCFTLSTDEAVALADQLVDAVERQPQETR